MSKKKSDEDVIVLVTRSLRGATPELRTQIMECVVGEMVSAADWGSLTFWHGELEHALMQYFQLLGRTNHAVCQHCYRNLGPGLQERLKGKIEIERAVR